MSKYTYYTLGEFEASQSMFVLDDVYACDLVSRELVVVIKDHELAMATGAIEYRIVDARQAQLEAEHDAAMERYYRGLRRRSILTWTAVGLTALLSLSTTYPDVRIKWDDRGIRVYEILR